MPSTGEFVFYYYDPILGVALHYAILFALLTITGIVWVVVSVRRYGNLVGPESSKTVIYIMLPYLVGLLMEVISYVARCFSSIYKEEPTPYIIQSALIFMAPSLISVTFYMLLGQIISLLEAEHHSPVKRQYLTKLFVIGDVVSFLMQCLGGAVMSSGYMKPGRILIAVGLIIQIMFICGFLCVVVTFLRRTLKNPTKASSISRDSSSFFGGWLHALWTLVVCFIFILIRCIFRMIEYLQGNDGSLMSREVYFFAFESVMIFLCGVASEIFGFPRFLLRFEVRFASVYRDEQISLKRIV